MFPGMLTPAFAAVGAFVAGIVVATYFERSRSNAERAGWKILQNPARIVLADTVPSGPGTH